MLQHREIGATTTESPIGHPPTSKYDKLISLAKQVPPANTVVVHPCDESSLRGPCEAAESRPFWWGRPRRSLRSPGNMGSISLTII